MALTKFPGVKNFEPGEPWQQPEPGFHLATIQDVSESRDHEGCPYVRFKCLDPETKRYIGTRGELFRVTEASQSDDAANKSASALQQQEAFTTLAMRCGIDVSKAWDPAELVKREVIVLVDEFEGDNGPYVSIPKNAYWPADVNLESLDYVPNYVKLMEEREQASSARRGFGGKR